MNHLCRKCVSHRTTCRFLDVFYKQCSKHVRALTIAFQNCRGPVKKTIRCLMAPMATYRFLQSPYTLATKYLRKCIGPQWKSIGCLMARVATYRFPQGPICQLSTIFCPPALFFEKIKKPYGKSLKTNNFQGALEVGNHQIVEMHGAPYGLL